MHLLVIDVTMSWSKSLHPRNENANNELGPLVVVVVVVVKGPMHWTA